MKKVFLLLVAFASLALAQDAESMSTAEKLVANPNLILIAVGSAIGAGIGFGLAALGGAIGIGNLSAATVAGTARNPGMGGKLLGTMFIAFALIEAQVIYMLVVALLLFYGNPFL